jgi:hypothetical protein
VYLQRAGHDAPQPPVAVAAPAELQPGCPQAQVGFELSNSAFENEVDAAHDGKVGEGLFLLACGVGV